MPPSKRITLARAITPTCIFCTLPPGGEGRPLLQERNPVLRLFGALRHQLMLVLSSGRYIEAPGVILLSLLEVLLNHSICQGNAAKRVVQ
eukprot:scaffold788_cov231-Pinguiococcus_pyrenoidosus.AAC.11